MNLGAVTPYSSTVGSSRVRVFDWVDHLDIPATVISMSQRGREDFKSFAGLSKMRSTRAEALRLAKESDIFFLHRQFGLWGRGTPPLPNVDQLRIFDLDDATFIKRSKYDLRSTRTVNGAKSADRIIAGNELIAEWSSELCDDVTVIPSCVETSQYEAKENYAPNEIPQILWMGSWSGETYLVDLADVLRSLNEDFGAILTIVGDPNADTPLPLSNFTRRIPWSIEFQRNEMRSFDVGIMPLRDGAFERGKCAYKLLQYGAAALPMVGSPVGANEKVLNEFGALAASTPKEWANALRDLLQSSESDRSKVGARSRSVVEASYSFSAHAVSWQATVGLT